MRTSVPILAATLALTVFLTSLVLQTREGAVNRASINVGRLDAIPNTSSLLTEPQGNLTTPCSAAEPRREIPEKTRELLARAQQFIRAGNVDGGIELLRAALKTDPDNREALVALGLFAFSRGLYAEAEAHFRHVLEMDPDGDGMFRARLGVAQMRQRKYGPALENLRIVMRQIPDDGALHFALACIYAKLMECERALYHLQAAYAQLGPVLLAHISDPHLDSLRSTPKFQAIVSAARAQYAQAFALPKTGTAGAPQP